MDKGSNSKQPEVQLAHRCLAAGPCSNAAYGVDITSSHKEAFLASSASASLFSFSKAAQPWQRSDSILLKSVAQ